MPGWSARAECRRRASDRNRRAQGRDRRASSRNTSPAAAGSRRATTPCWLANRAPTTSCSASRTAAGRRFDAVLERVAWWTEMFQVPCVAYAANVDEVEALARAGADFVAVGEAVWRDRARASRAAVGAAHGRGARAMRCARLLILGAAIGVLAGDGRRRAGRCRSPRRSRGRRRAFRRSRRNRKRSRRPRSNRRRRPPPKPPALKKSIAAPAAPRPRRRAADRASRRKTRWCSSPSRRRKSRARRP